MSKKLGLGVMIHMLFDGNENPPSKYLGRKIIKANLLTSKGRAADALRLDFGDGVVIDILDGGQSCCEDRYMRTDDDIRDLEGHKLIAIETREVEYPPAKYGDHEVVFLDVKTDGGMVSFSFHNEHNGYYGGFALKIEEHAK